MTCTYPGPRVQPCRNPRPGHGATTLRDQQPGLSKLHCPQPGCAVTSSDLKRPWGQSEKKPGTRDSRDGHWR